MKKLIVILWILLPCLAIAQTKKSFYDFTVKDIEGKNFDLSSLKGKKVLVVNVASKCGLTPQYKDLQAIYEQYGGDNFTIIAFPSNDFMGQEPGTNTEIQEFCTNNYGVSFPLMDKITVVGDKMAPLYKWLTDKNENGKMYAPVQWNFQKFLINEDGSLQDMVSPKNSPYDDKIITWIKAK